MKYFEAFLITVGLMVVLLLIINQGFLVIDLR